MKLAFYYHIPIATYSDDYFIPSLLGVFLNDLASKVERLMLVAHTTDYNPQIHDCKLRRNGIEVFDLGRKKRFPHRLFFGCNKLHHVVDNIDCDVLLVRAPTPLGPKLYERFKKKCTVVYLLVGDYSTLPQKKYSLRGLSLYYYEYLMNHRVLPYCHTMVNSRSLYNKYSKISMEAKEVRTTTITENDFYYRKDTCNSNIIHLLYVGRYDWQKGFSELFEAVSKLKCKRNVILHMVGWDDTPSQSIKNGMEERIKELGISDFVILEGKKKLGEELNSMYRTFDIFVLPSYSEGMPRCIWEAMANGLPVISTNVGGIPYNIKDGEDALLISPHDSTAIVDAVGRMVDNPLLRQSLIKNGYEKAKEATLEKSNSKIVDYLSGCVYVE